ncbi:hypothetical protein DAEQUDRAFT_470803 [Daedalea quercina L-15889]|uniref:Uncharacterized protein n=1 Tax=Daedalea quercina L-15889 TaxID=1314783 RepID=A0A165THF7_9APHY|nr:hypothetical protein DAEQUDRAFT_470803 [Daedalea quercina L-15889]
MAVTAITSLSILPSHAGGASSVVTAGPSVDSIERSCVMLNNLWLVSKGGFPMLGTTHGNYSCYKLYESRAVHLSLKHPSRSGQSIAHPPTPKAKDSGVLPFLLEAHEGACQLYHLWARKSPRGSGCERPVIVEAHGDFRLPLISEFGLKQPRQSLLPEGRDHGAMIYTMPPKAMPGAKERIASVETKVQRGIRTGWA